MVAVLWRCRWGRLCLGGVGGAVWSHGCCGRAGLLGVPVGGGPPASRTRRELRSARRLEARPGPAAAHGHRSLALRSLLRPPHRRRCLADVWLGASPRGPDSQLWLSTSNFARNSSMAHSNIECASLELQRFCGVSKNDHVKLRAKCGWRWCRRLSWVSQPGPAARGCRSLALSDRWAGCLKLASPLRVRNGCFECVFRLQRCCRFQRSLVGGEQWC